MQRSDENKNVFVNFRQLSNTGVFFMAEIGQKNCLLAWVPFPKSHLQHFCSLTTGATNDSAMIETWPSFCAFHSIFYTTL